MTIQKSDNIPLAASLPLAKSDLEVRRLMDRMTYEELSALARTDTSTLFSSITGMTEEVRKMCVAFFSELKKLEPTQEEEISESTFRFRNKLLLSVPIPSPKNFEDTAIRPESELYPSVNAQTHSSHTESSPPLDDLLGVSEQAAFRREMLRIPDNRDTQLLYYSDWLIENSNPLGELLLAEMHLHENRDSEQISALITQRLKAKSAHAIATLSHFFPEPEAPSSLQESPWPEDWLKDGKLHTIGPSLPEHVIAAFALYPPAKQVEILSTFLRLPEQFADGHSLLRRSNLITKNDAEQEGFWEQQPSSASPKTQGIWHPLPTYTESGNSEVFSLLRHLHTCPQEQRTMLFQRALQGFDQLRITPRRPMPPMRDALTARLKANADRIPGGLNDAESVWMWDQYDPDSRNYNPADALVYHPEQFDDGYGQPLTAGYDITLVEDIRVLPEKGKEPVTAGYRSLGRNLSATDGLDLIHGRSNDHIITRKLDPQDYQGLIGWTPQHYCIANMASLDASGLPLDQDEQSWRWSFLPGAYFPSSRYASDGVWFPRDCRVGVSRRVPGFRGAFTGARVAVRVF